MAYSFKRSITIDHTKVGATDQTNFPVLFMGTYAYLAGVGSGGNVQNASGFDIIFTSDAGGTTPLNFEIDSYTSASGAVAFWIKVPSVSHTVDTVIYIFYGNASISTFQGNVNGTWDANYLAVYHFPATGASVTTSNCTDSTSNGRTLSNLIGSPTLAAGQIGQCFVGNGSQAAYNNVATNLPAAAPASVEGWAKAASTAQSGNEICGFGGNSVNGQRFVINILDSTHVREEGRNCNASAPFTWDTNWHHFVITLPSGQTTSSGVKIYVDGVSKTVSGDGVSFALNATGDIAVCAIPGAEGSGFNFNGSVDEFRVSNVERSADWALASFNNQSSPATFYTVGSAVAASGSLFRASNLSGLGAGGPFFQNPLN